MPCRRCCARSARTCSRTSLTACSGTPPPSRTATWCAHTRMRSFKLLLVPVSFQLLLVSHSATVEDGDLVHAHALLSVAPRVRIFSWSWTATWCTHPHTHPRAGNNTRTRTRTRTRARARKRARTHAYKSMRAHMQRHQGGVLPARQHRHAGQHAGNHKGKHARKHAAAVRARVRTH